MTRPPPKFPFGGGFSFSLHTSATQASHSRPTARRGSSPPAGVPGPPPPRHCPWRRATAVLGAAMPRENEHKARLTGYFVVFNVFPRKPKKSLRFSAPGVMVFVLLYIPLKSSLCPFVLKHRAPAQDTRSYKRDQILPYHAWLPTARRGSSPPAGVPGPPPYPVTVPRGAVPLQ